MASALISVTDSTTSEAYKLSASKIVQFLAAGSGATITYIYTDGFAKQVTVTQSVSTINAAALNTFPVTLTDTAGTTLYLNADFICNVVTRGSGSTIFFDQKKTSFSPIDATETPAAIQTLVNDLITDITFDDITVQDPIAYSTATGITAFAGGGQASATALTEEFNNVTTVATAGDSVKLPAAVAGFSIKVKNSGAAALDIFPASGDSINALAINLAVRIQPGSEVKFSAINTTVWESNTDESITITAPTTLSGGLELKASNSAGNFITTITNASQAAARTYTIPDAGASASFVMTAGAQTVAGLKTFDNGIATDTIAEETAAAGVTIDSVLLKDGGVSNSGATMFAGFYPTAAQQALSGAGAINVTSYYTAWTTTGAEAGTLASGTQIGQRKKITLVVDGGDGTLTLTGYTSIVFDDAGDFVELMWNGSAWFVLENSGCTVTP